MEKERGMRETKTRERERERERERQTDRQTDRQTEGKRGDKRKKRRRRQRDRQTDRDREGFDPSHKLLSCQAELAKSTSEADESIMPKAEAWGMLALTCSCWLLLSYTGGLDCFRLVGVCVYSAPFDTLTPFTSAFVDAFDWSISHNR